VHQKNLLDFGLEWHHSKKHREEKTIKLIKYLPEIPIKVSKMYNRKPTETG
jgi:hypothetical protein